LEKLRRIINAAKPARDPELRGRLNGLYTTNRQIRCAPRKNVILCANTSQYRLACLLVAALPRCVAAFFVGCAIGSALGGWAYAQAGWTLTAWMGSAPPVAALVHVMTE